MSSGNEMKVVQAQAQIQLQQKSVAISVILTFLFGGLGLLYASITWGLICLVIDGILLAITIFTAGFGAVLYVPFRVLLIILAIVMVGRHNKRLLNNTFKST